MANSTHDLDLISPSQASPEITANMLFAAGSTGIAFGRRESTSVGLTWGYYGGTTPVAGSPTQVANGTLTLTASTTNYIEMDPAGVVSVNTTSFTPGSTPLYEVVVGVSAPTSWIDYRLAIGTPGVTGDPGAVWRTGSGVPSNGLGIDGDFYLRTANGAVYEKSGGTYSVVANITGPTGAAGSGGATGPAGSSLVWFGTGEDGAAVLNGSNTYAWASLAGSTYTLTRNVMLTTCTLNSGITLATAGYAVFTTGAFANAGTITVAGANATSSTTHGAGGGALGMYGAGADGGDSNGSANGQAGSGTTASIGGSGGRGGTGAGTRGAAGVATPPTLGVAHGSNLFSMQTGVNAGNTGQKLTGGGGGGSGCGDGSNPGGPGGGGGGVVGIFAQSISGAGLLRANGGDGKSPTAGTNIGGGGGGGGGVIYMLTQTASPETVWGVSVAGGVGGTHRGTGGDGENGVDGRKFIYQV